MITNINKKTLFVFPCLVFSENAFSSGGYYLISSWEIVTLIVSLVLVPIAFVAIVLLKKKISLKIRMLALVTMALSVSAFFGSTGFYSSTSLSDATVGYIVNGSLFLPIVTFISWVIYWAISQAKL